VTDQSELQLNPKSQVVEHGYINIYSYLSQQERRQIFFNTEYKKNNPNWDNTMVLLCKEFQTILQEIKKPGTYELRVLDAGCGNGNYVIDEYRKEISWATGIDKDKISTRNNICLDEIIHGDLASLPFADDSFDVVLSFWVLEHIENPQAVFKEINRVLKKDGFFIFATPNKHSALLVLKRLLRKGLVNFINEKLYGRAEVDIFPAYYKANSVSDLTELLDKAGFAQSKVELNYDPGYTSFGKFTFFISNILDKIFERINPEYYKHHIVGVARKK